MRARLLTIPEAADRIGCSRAHVYNLISAGLLNRHDISLPPRNGGPRRPKTRVSDTDVDAYIESIRQPVPTRTAS